MVWTVEIRETAARQIARLDAQHKTRIVRFLRERIQGIGDPRSIGHALTGDLAGLWRYRVGDYRLLCHLQDEIVTVMVLELGHRRDVYR
ncbi:MAG: type II toxin-antitoxin system RelE/ParE family toxin [Magnetococcales bacterium]|nr:type II toxin-antitoxin system RelE/ParE family toxin [Magnetococcales bacterium]